MEDLNRILLVCIILAPCLALLAYIFTRKKIHNLPLDKRRKRLLIFLGVFIFIEILIVSIFGYITCDRMGDFLIFLKETFGTKSAMIQMIVFVLIFCYAFFRKEPIKKMDKKRL